MEMWKALAEHMERGPWIAVIAATVIRRVLRYDRDLRAMIETAVTAAFVIFLIAPGVAEYFDLGQKASAAAGAAMALVAKPALHAAIRLARRAQDDPDSIIRRRDRR